MYTTRSVPSSRCGDSKERYGDHHGANISNTVENPSSGRAYDRSNKFLELAAAALLWTSKSHLLLIVNSFDSDAGKWTRVLREFATEHPVSEDHTSRVRSLYLKCFFCSEPQLFSLPVERFFVVRVHWRQLGLVVPRPVALR